MYVISFSGIGLEGPLFLITVVFSAFISFSLVASGVLYVVFFLVRIFKFFILKIIIDFYMILELKMLHFEFPIFRPRIVIVFFQEVFISIGPQQRI